MCSDSKPFDFGLCLRELRTAAKLTQSQLADRTGISRSTLYRYENSQNLPDSDIIVRLALALHTTTDYLLGLDDAPTIKIYHLKPGQAAVMYNFIEQFVERKDGQHNQKTGDDRHVNGILQVTLRTLQ